MANEALVAADGSMWLLSSATATHVNVDQSSATVPLRSESDQETTVGSKAVTYDGRTFRWLDGADIDLAGVFDNPSEAILQVPGDAASSAWIGSGDMLACVGETGIDDRLEIQGLSLGFGDRLAVAGTTGVVVTDNNDVTRIDLESEQLAGNDDKPTVNPGTEPLTITAANDMIWLDDLKGRDAWVVQRFGINAIDKATDAPLLDAQGQVQDQGDGLEPSPTPGGPNTAGDDEIDHADDDGEQDPPTAVDDSVTARAGNPITIPVTANDFDPDGDAIAVYEGDAESATHGTTDVLSGTSITYRPEPGILRDRLVRLHDRRRERSEGHGNCQHRVVLTQQPQQATDRS